MEIARAAGREETDMITAAESNATERKRRVEKYFVKSPDPNDLTKARILIGVAGLAALCCLISFAGGNAFLGFILVGGGAYCAVKGSQRKRAYDEQYEKAEPKPADQAMDALLASDLRTIEGKAMQELGLTAEDLETADDVWDPVLKLSHGKMADRPRKRPIVVYGPAASSGFAIGKDGIWRFRRYEVMVICPTHHHLAIYSSELSLLTGGLLHEQTQEFQYAHVVSVSTVTMPVPELKLAPADAIDDDEEVRFAATLLRKFEVGVSSGRSTSVTVGISDEKDPEKQAHLPPSGIQEIIGSVRRVLRDKSTGTGTFGRL
jgi:hypothetical protein